MSTRITYLWLIVLSIALIVSTPRTKVVKAATSHQYKVVLTNGDDDLERLLNEYAKDGWDYVGITQPEGHQHYVILRRGDGR